MPSRDDRTIESQKAEIARLQELLRITEDNLRASQDEVMRLSTVDMLTGTSHRRHFLDVADQEMSRARRYRRPLAVLSVIVDNIRAINETHGTVGGDSVLQAMGDAILRTLRTTDSVGRVAGSDFAVLLPETDHEGCISLADRLAVEVSQSAAMALDHAPPPPLISIGATHVVRDDVIFDVVLRRADQAMRLARAKGGGCAVYLSAEQADRTAEP